VKKPIRVLLAVLWFWLVSAPVDRVAAGQTMPVAGTVALKLTVTSVKPGNVELVRGGAAVDVKIEGGNLHHADLHGEALVSGRVKRGVVVSFDKPGQHNRRVMKLNALAQAGPGPYVIRLQTGSLSAELQLAVKVRPATAAELTHLATTRVGELATRGRGLHPPAQSAVRKPVAGAAQAGGTIPARNILARPAVGAAMLGPHLVVQTGTGEFEAYAKAVGFAAPDRLTFQWSHNNQEVAYGQWEVTHDNFVVMKGSTGAAPAPGVTKKFDIDFRRFVNLPAPGNPVKYRVHVRGKKAPAVGPKAQVQAAADDESLFVTPPSNAVVVTYAAQPDSVFTSEGIPEEDADHDGFRDTEENALAAEFRPYFIFDAEESYRQPNEPVVIFQAHCLQSDGWCTHAQIKYYYLFREDGGWQSCSPWCDNAHNGDNQSLTIEIFRHTAEANNPYVYWYFNWGADRYDYTHPVLYLSAGKHHDYISTSWNHVWDGVCCDDVAGDGDQVFPDVKTGDRYHNVGEAGYHLIDDLSFLGYPGECTWCGKPFRGGLEDDEGDSSAFEWM
jgi:hypothetical protein